MTWDAARDAALDAMLLHREVEEFLHREADLLDSRQFEAWLDLLTDDVQYWMPLHRNFSFGSWDTERTRKGRDLNWFDEGKFELEQRVKQILTGRHWAEEPTSRTSHMISNLEIAARNDGHIQARCRFLVYRNRTEAEWDLFVGKREDLLRREGEHLRIASREVFLDQNVLLAKNLTLFF